MNIDIDEILEDLYLIDPSLREMEAELKDIIKKLAGSKPESEPDEEFRARLKKELLSKIEKQNKSRKKILPFKRAYIFRAAGATAAAALAVALGFQLFTVRDDGVYLKNEGVPESAVMSDTDITFAAEPERLTEKEHIAEQTAEERNEQSPLPAADEPEPVKHTEQPDPIPEQESRPEKESTSEKPVEIAAIKTEETRAVNEPAPGLPSPAPTSEKESSGSLLSRLFGRNEAPEAEPMVMSKSAADTYMADTTGAGDYPATGAAEDDYFAAEEMEDAEEFALESPAREDFNTEEYERIHENDFIEVMDEPLSTFSIDVDTASYANVRRYLTSGTLPPPDAVRIEELINYFSYDYPRPEGDAPFSFTTETASCPWNVDNILLKIGLQGYEVSKSEMPPSNLVFLLDVSGSMSDRNKLPLLKESMALLIDTLDQDDRVSIVAYAGAAGLVLPPTSGSRKDRILGAMDRLEAGGSTAGGEGIELAYAVAEENFFPEGNNRVIIATDGDFNVGQSSQGELTRLIEEKREKGIFLTVLGLGMGNYKDSRMESLADSGNGNYAYIDTLSEARKVLVNEMESTLLTIAKDVKIQIEFNPAVVESYRLVGYENRVLENRDFDDDTKDAGEIGAGHSVTALYEIVRANTPDAPDQSAELRYQETTVRDEAAEGFAGELGFIKFRYKKPDEDQSILITSPVPFKTGSFSNATEDFRFAASVAEWGMLLRGSSYLPKQDPDRIIGTVKKSLGEDVFGYRAEFLTLLYKTRDFLKM